MPHCGIRILEDGVYGAQAEILGCNIQFDQADIGIHVELPNPKAFLDMEFTNIHLTANEISPGAAVNDPRAYQCKKCIYGDPISGTESEVEPSGVFVVNNGSLTVFGGMGDNVIEWRIPSDTVALMVSNIRFDANVNSLPGSVPNTTGLFAANGRIQLHGCVFNKDVYQYCFFLEAGVSSGIIYGNDYNGNPPGQNNALDSSFRVAGSVISNDVKPGGTADVDVAHPTNPLQLRRLHFNNGLFVGYDDHLR